MPNILLVEDDQTIAEALKFALENSAFSCNWFTTGSEALNHFSNNQVDLVLLDIGLPDIEGFDVLRHIRRTHDTPVIMLTARGESTDQVLALEGLEADDYIIKESGSDSPRVIIAKIKALLRRSENSASIENKNVSNADLVFNEAMQQVSLKGEVLDLTNAECRILEYFIKHPNRILTRSELLNAMHDLPTGSDETTINTHMRSIRNKIKAMNGGDYIETHRGLGYSFSQ